jgi:Transporter associated domain/CBS domain
VPDTADALDVLDLIKGSAVHMALVHDEYGQFQGVVTNADILEAIVGDFRTDEGPAEPEAVQRDDGSWLIEGSMPADELAERLSIALPSERSYHTAAGFVLSQFGYLPAVGERFDYQGWRFEVVDLDGRRIDKILARRGGLSHAFRCQAVAPGPRFGDGAGGRPDETIGLAGASTASPAITPTTLRPAAWDIDRRRRAQLPPLRPGACRVLGSHPQIAASTPG